VLGDEDDSSHLRRLRPEHVRERLLALALVLHPASSNTRDVSSARTSVRAPLDFLVDMRGGARGPRARRLESLSTLLPRAVAAPALASGSLSPCASLGVASRICIAPYIERRRVNALCVYNESMVKTRSHTKTTYFTHIILPRTWGVLLVLNS
jgi:hypothetical protein